MMQHDGIYQISLLKKTYRLRRQGLSTCNLKLCDLYIVGSAASKDHGRTNIGQTLLVSIAVKLSHFLFLPAMKTGCLRRPIGQKTVVFACGRRSLFQVCGVQTWHEKMLLPSTWVKFQSLIERDETNCWRYPASIVFLNASLFQELQKSS